MRSRTRVTRPRRIQRGRLRRLEQGPEEQDQALAESVLFYVAESGPPLAARKEAGDARVVYYGRVQLARGEPALAEVPGLRPRPGQARCRAWTKPAPGRWVRRHAARRG